jgi:hypothetical protein
MVQKNEKLLDWAAGNKPMPKIAGQQVRAVVSTYLDDVLFAW